VEDELCFVGEGSRIGWKGSPVWLKKESDLFGKEGWSGRRGARLDLELKLVVDEKKDSGEERWPRGYSINQSISRPP
jgi:hypothetical protein